MHNWVDNAGITKENMQEFSLLVNITLEQMKTKRPIVVHCSAGCGRTGTFIAICNAIAAMEELTKFGKAKHESGYDLTPRISVFSIVRRLREQRWTLVKTESQYRSIYEFLLSYYCGITK